MTSSHRCLASCTGFQCGSTSATKSSCLFVSPSYLADDWRLVTDISYQTIVFWWTPTLVVGHTQFLWQ